MKQFPENFKIRRATANDAPELVDLFKTTVRKVNSQDYTSEQIMAWVPDDYPIEKMVRGIESSIVIVSSDSTGLTGMGSLCGCSLFHMLYIRHDRIRQGLGRRLMKEVETVSKMKGADCIYAKVSITGRPAFLASGYEEIRKQTIEINGQYLVNYKMYKPL